MSENRNTKDLEFGFESYDTKDLNPILENKPNNTNSGTNPEINNKPEPKETSFYSRRKPENKKWWSKKWGKAVITLTSLSALGIGLGVGLYFGLMPSTKNSLTIPDYEWDEIKDWVDSQVEKDVKKQVEVLKSEAIVYEFNQYADAGKITNATRKKNRATKDAENAVSKEKDDYRKRHGSSWNTEWVKYLVTNGYDNEQEYINSKISTQLESEVTNLFTLNQFVNATASQIASGNYQYYSTTPIKGTENSATPLYVAIKNGSEPSSWGRTSVDLEQYITFFLQTQNLITTTDVKIPFTFTGNVQGGLSPSAIKFAGINDLNNIFYTAKDMALSLQATTGNTLGYSNLFNFLNKSGGSTTGLKKINTAAFANQSLTNSIFNTLYFGAGDTNFTDVTTRPTPRTNINYSANTTFDILYGVNDAIAQTIYSENNSFWAGYSEVGGDLVTPTTYQEKADSFSQVKEIDFGNTLLERNIQSVGNFLYQGTSNDGTAVSYSKPWSNFVGGAKQDLTPGSLPTMEANRSVSSTIELNTNSGWTGSIPTNNRGNDTLLFTTSSDGITVTKIETMLQEEMLTGIAPNNQTLVWYEINPATSLWELKKTDTNVPAYSRSTVTSGLSVLGERMLISDLNKRANNQYANFTPVYGVMDLFNQTFTSQYKKLALNNALSDNEFLTSHDLSSDPSAGVEYDDYMAVVDSFYNELYSVATTGYLNTYKAFTNLYLGNSNIFYIDPSDPLFVQYQNLMFEAKYWMHDYDQEYQYNTIEWFIINGGNI